MIDVFYAKRQGNSKDFASFVLEKYYGYENLEFSRVCGKPVCDAPVCFSLSHTQEHFFFAVSKNEVGIDAENIYRKGDFPAVLAKLREEERRLIGDSPQAFLRFWTKREAVCKYLSLPVFASLRRLNFLKSTQGENAIGDANDVAALLDGNRLDISLYSLQEGDTLYSVCGNKGETVTKIEYVEYPAQSGDKITFLK